MAMAPTQIGCNMEQEPDVTNIDKFIEYHWRRGWDEAIQYVIDIIGEMQYTYDWHNPTLDELEQRIVWENM